VMTSVVVVLGAMAWLRDDRPTAGLLFEVAGRAMITGGIRTPLDIVLYTHYATQVKHALPDDVVAANRTAAADLTIADAIALGLREPSPTSSGTTEVTKFGWLVGRGGGI
jgi:hypothetical protein